MKVLLILTLAFHFSFLRYAFASHFRGGLIMWKPTGIGRQVTVTFRMAWRRSYNSGGVVLFCDEQTKIRGNLIANNLGDIICFNCGRSGSTMSSTRFHCTDFSTKEDWTEGERSFNFTFKQDYVEFGFRGNAWIGTLVKGGGNWELRTKANLSIRSDIGRINSSPRSAMPPIVRIQHECNHTITIPVQDFDGDNIRCRWSTSRQNECAGICQAFTGAVIDERKCLIHYSASGKIGWYAVAIQIEDFATSNSSTALSSVSLQFLVEVFNSGKFCKGKPVFISPTRANGACIGIPLGTTWKEKLIARSGAESVRIREINTVSPIALIKSHLTGYDSSGRDWYLNVTWTPSENQKGRNIFCYTASDDDGLASERSCITLFVGVDPPTIEDDSMTPAGDIYPSDTIFIVKYDKMFVRPKRSSFIYFYTTNNTLKEQIDVASSNDVQYPVNSQGRELQIRINFMLKEKENFYIKMDPGIAKGTTECGAESSALWDPRIWTFRVRDVTPPVLTFGKLPSVTNGNITLTWTYNEPISAETCYIVRVTNDLIDTTCNGSWKGENLEEGYYTIYVQGTDTENNTAAPQKYTWYIDKTGPSVSIISKPNWISNVQRPQFRFRCNEDCNLKCSIYERNSSSRFLFKDLQKWQRDHYLTSRTLQSGKMYNIIIYPTDKYGNQGNETVFTWKTDFQPPDIDGIIDMTVDCNKGVATNVTGIPRVKDESGISDLSYNDKMVQHSTCKLRRTWTATDLAGNTATTSQILIYVSRTQPKVCFPNQSIVACGSLLQVTKEVFTPSIKIKHPCGLPMTISYKDPPPANSCDVTFIRTWIASDNCGATVKGTQIIQVLEIQDPIAPKRGQITGLKPIFSWNNYPGSKRYKIYIWNQTEKRPIIPTYLSYYVNFKSGALYPGTKYFWQVQFVLNSGNKTVYSPRWYFQTQRYPDLSIISISLPPVAYSGRSFVARWTVQNQGKASTKALYWHDTIYAGFSKDFDRAHLITSVPQRHILFQNDTYQSAATIYLKDNDIGLMYVFVRVDQFNDIRDFQRVNNFRRGSKPVDVQLTPPPDLQVTSITTPKSSYSGHTIQIRYTISNKGRGTTKVNRWRDGIYWSADIFKNTSDVQLKSMMHNGGLTSYEEYTVAADIVIPKYIYGQFYIIVGVDVDRNVFEYNMDDNNWKSSENVTVELTPPPDLSVIKLTVTPQHKCKTGDMLIITWTVKNIGFRLPDRSSWFDQVILHSVGETYPIGQFVNKHNLNQGESYNQTVSFIIHSNIESGLYNLSVQTDFRSYVFEYQSRQNNLMSDFLNITQELPDLSIEDMSITLLKGETGNNVLNVTWKVRNIGKGPTLGQMWSDIISLIKDRKFNFQLANVPIQIPSLNANELYSKSILLHLPANVYGKQEVTLNIDNFAKLLERNRGNNNRMTALNIPLHATDFHVLSLRCTKESVNSGETIELRWKVINKGISIGQNTYWYDKVEVTLDRENANISVASTFVIQSNIMPTNGTYTGKTVIEIPDNVVGNLNIKLNVNYNQRVFEGPNVSDNNMVIPIKVTTPPSPDLIVSKLSYTMSYLSGNIEKMLTITWKIKNIGNTITDICSWVDVIGLSSTSMIISEKILLSSFQQSRPLPSQVEYTFNRTVVIPPKCFGRYFIFVQTDFKNNLREVNGEENNVIFNENPIQLLEPSTANLIGFVDNVTECEYAKTVCITYTVKNIGDLPTQKTSWNDALYVSMKKDASIYDADENRKTLITKTHIGILPGGEYYSSGVKFSVEFNESGKRLYFFVFPDFEEIISYSQSENAKNVNISSTPKVFNNSVFFVPSQPSLSNLRVSMNSTSLVFLGGEPMTTEFEIINDGHEDVSRPFYIALYVSSDPDIDQFERKLGVRVIKEKVLINTSVLANITVFLPFGMDSQDYVVSIQIDSRHDIIEENEHDNIATSVIYIHRNIPTDIVVFDVESPINVSYGEEMTVYWKIKNNGSKVVNGYKCDDLYLSQDSRWDITDEPIGISQCGFMSVVPYSNASKYLEYNIKAQIPSISAHKYKTIVKSRTNIPDNNITNNIGVSKNDTYVTFDVLAIDKQHLFSFDDNNRKVFQIESVPPGKTLIIYANEITNTTFLELFLNYNKPPTDFSFDFTVANPFQTFQTITIPNCKSSNYYVMVRKTLSTQSMIAKEKISIKVKIAKFEILNLFPREAAPLGNVTLQIEGSLIPEDVTAELFDSKFHAPAIRIFWFSSTFMAATFDIRSFSPNSSLSLNVTSKFTGKKIIVANALVLKSGFEGQVVAKLLMPGPLFVGQKDVIHVDVINIGDSDIDVPLLIITSENAAEIRLVNEYEDFPWALSYSVTAGLDKGPGGVLPPMGTSRLTFEVNPVGTNTRKIRSKITVSLIEPAKSKASTYIEMKNTSRPSHYTIESWEKVWDNFMALIGPSWYTLNNKIADVMNEMSISGQHPRDLDQMMVHLLTIADGLGPEEYLERTIDLDIHLKTQSESLYLDLSRLYPMKIGMRHINGPIGKGWILPLWETKIKHIYETRIIMSLNREDFVFTIIDTGFYLNAELGSLYYDEEGLISFDNPQNSAKYSFDIKTGNLTYVRLDSGEIYLLTHDQKGYLTTLEINSEYIFFTYDENGRLTTMNRRTSRIHNDDSCSFKYNERGLLSAVACGEHFIAYTYNENTDLIKCENSNGSMKLITYTEEGYVESEEIYQSSFMLSKKTYTYFGNSKVNVRVVPENTDTTYWVNADGSIASKKVNGFPIFKYISGITSYTTIHGDMVFKESIYNDNTINIRDGNGDKVTETQDDAGHLIEYIDGNENRYLIDRNHNGSISAIIYPDDSFETYLYRDKEIEITSREGMKTVLHFDEEDRLVLLERDNEDNTLSFRYGESGNLASINHRLTVFSFTYFDDHTIKSVALDQNTILRYAYDSQKRKIEMALQNLPYTVKYENNVDGKIKSIQNKADDHTIVQYSYNDIGVLENKTTSNGISSIFSYFERTHLVKELRNVLKNGTLVSKFLYSYDSRQNVISIKTTEGIWKMNYDLSDQLTQFTDPSSSQTSYRYDSGKNRGSMEEKGIFKTFKKNSLSQYTSVDDETFKYDMNGNMVLKGQITLQYDDTNKLVMFTTPKMNCSLFYNPLGFIKEKRCFNFSTVYLTDENGRILMETTEDSVASYVEKKYYFYASTGELVALRTDDGAYHYFLFDAFGSVVGLTDQFGNIENMYVYEPFGRFYNKRTTIQTPFAFQGQHGFIQIAELPDIYITKSRLYDTTLGRFLNADKLGIFCQKPNPYLYLNNNPMKNYHENYLKDGCSISRQDIILLTLYNPETKLVIPKMYGIASKNTTLSTRVKRSLKAPTTRQYKRHSGAIANIIVDVFDVDNSLQKHPIVKWGIKFLISKSIFDLVKLIPPPYGTLITAANFIYKHRKCLMSLCKCLENTTQKIDNAYNNVVNGQQMDRLINGTCKKIVGIIPNEKSKKHVCSTVSRKTQKMRSDLLNSTIGSYINKGVDFATSALDSAANACNSFKTKAQGFVRWIRSHDPNDIQGPNGYGAAKFISKNIDLIYKIRFENNANATAPAQRVLIEIPFDNKFNIRSFRLGSFGFGNVNRKLKFELSVLQEKINMTDEFGVFVEVKAGLDIINNKGKWEFQAVDPSTGSPPADPTVGFLPPNNGSNGQGFVIFSIKPDDQVQSLEKIRAKAVIMFDENEPMDTPEVFNTIDNKPPYINNVSVLPAELTGGSVVLKLDIKDDESGLDYVNIMLQTGDDGYIPLLNNARDNLVSLPLQPGHFYKVAFFPVDMIGNILLGKQDTNIIEIITPSIEVSCSDVQNCSGNGNCTGINLCMCSVGFYGNDCSKDTEPLDPPVIEMLAGSQENISVPLYLSSKTVNALPNTTIIIMCTGFPPNSSFNRGHIVNGKFFLSAEEFGEVLFIPPNDYQGNFTVHVEAVASIYNSTSESSRAGDILVKIEKPVSEDEREWFFQKYLKTTFQSIPTEHSTQKQTSTQVYTENEKEMKTSVSKQAIVGGSIGGIAAVCVLTVIILYGKRWWKKHKYIQVRRGIDNEGHTINKETTF